MSTGNTKSIFTSKMFWANIIGLVAMIIQGVTGNEVISLEMQGTILAVINIVLRTITKDAVTWG